MPSSRGSSRLRDVCPASPVLQVDPLLLSLLSETLDHYKYTYIHIYIYIITKNISEYIEVLVIHSNYEIVEPEMQRNLRILFVKDHMISFL